jgi:hypothetical protein
MSQDKFPTEVTMEDFINIDSDVAVIQEATDDIVNSTIGEAESGNEEEEDHVTKEMHESYNFLEARHMVRILMMQLTTFSRSPC